MVRQDRILISTFHPELTSDTTVHEYFVRMARPGNGAVDHFLKNASVPSAVPVEPR
jgi:hypothetical protein